MTISIKLKLRDYGITIAFFLRHGPCQTCIDINIALFIAW